jgi:hypothetical protein
MTSATASELAGGGGAWRGHMAEALSSSQQRWRLGCILGVVLFLLGVPLGCFGWLFAPLTPFMADWVTPTQGIVTVIAPARWKPVGSIMSPDGRRMILRWERYDVSESVIWNVETDYSFPIRIDGDDLCWVNADYIIIVRKNIQPYSLSYRLLTASDGRDVKIHIVHPAKEYMQPLQQQRLLERWRTADKLYLLNDFGASTPSMLSFEQGQWFIYVDLDRPTILDRAFIDQVPYNIIQDEESCSQISSYNPIPAPNGQVMVQRIAGSEATHLQIRTTDGNLIADVYKPGWHPRLLAWAPDSSGVYFSMVISGQAAGIMVPYTPIFKLTPLTPEQQRARTLGQVALWSGGGAALVAAGGGIVLWRRRRRTRG